MASAVALQRRMAGQVPAISTAALALGLFGVIPGSPAVSQTESASRDRLRDIHHTLVIAEGDLAVALRDRDFARAKSTNGKLFKLLSSGKEKLPASSCSAALEGLGGVAVAVGFAVHPVTSGPLGSMTADELRFSAQMRPAPEVVEKWYSEYSATYLNKMAACEQEAGAGPSPRVLPTQLTQK